jgi:cytochrome c-type biogenesis protein CcmF
MYIFGTSLIILAIVSSASASAAYALVTRGNVAMVRWGRAATWSALGFALGSAVLLTALFALQRYNTQYVFDYSSSDLEFRYRIAALWAGQPGSLVVWALIGLLCAPFLMRRTRHFEPYMLSTLMLLQVFLLVFMLVRNPFLPTNTADFPATAFGPNGQVLDGKGLNPQLHNVWMVIHPPTLFTGYGLLGVTFAAALAGLWRRDYDGWARIALPWTVAGWTILGLALTMGGYWAYETLGWGGYWAWDPVENASLVPWLVGGALIHGLLVQKSHGGLRRANFFLAILTYLAVFYASFLTRSGVLGAFSVHSFVEVGLKDIMLGTLVALAVLGVGVLAIRWRDVPRRALAEAILSRDTVFVLMMLTFVIIGVVVAFGTSMPWITTLQSVNATFARVFGNAFDITNRSIADGEVLGDGRFALQADFFKRTTSPLALILAVLMAFGPLLGWRGTNTRKLLMTMRWPFVAGVVLTSVGIVLGVRDALPLAFLLVATFAFGTNLLMLVRTLRGGWLRIGGYLSHVGMAVLLVGFVGSYVYASPEQQLRIQQGETQSVMGHSFTFWGYEEREGGKHVMRLHVDQETDKPFVASPQIFYNQRMQATVQTPAIMRYLWEDMYIAPAEYQPALDPNVTEISPGQNAAIGPYQLQFDKYDMVPPAEGQEVIELGAALTITHETTVQTVTPKLRINLTQGQFTPLPVQLPDGKTLVFENFNPNARLARLRVTGLNLPVQPAYAVFTVSTKPAIALVWLGALLMTVGGGMAVVRRRWEAVGAEETEPRRVPRAGGWVVRVPGLRGTRR